MNAIEPTSEELRVWREVDAYFNARHSENDNINLRLADAKIAALTDAVEDLVNAIDHPMLRHVFGMIEDSGTAEADKLWQYVASWFSTRDSAEAKGRYVLSRVEQIDKLRPFPSEEGYAP